jgi:hypothetical protein
VFSKKQEEDEDLCICPECFFAALTNNFHVEEVHNHAEQEQIIVDILNKIATEKYKHPKTIKYLLLDQQNNGINKRFWESLDETLPDHKYNYVGYCYCGAMDLKE